GSLLINFKYEQMKLFHSVMKEAFRKNDYDLNEMIYLFVRLSDYARKEGLLALEIKLDDEDVQDPFIKKGILLAVDGIEREMIHEIMDAEMNATLNRQDKGRALIEKAGAYAPAWGMIATLTGLVLMLSSLDDPASLGPNTAVALLPTLHGTILANLVILPMASKLEIK